MSTRITPIRNREETEIGTIFFDEVSCSWCIESKAEPDFRQTFPSEKDAFDFWHRNFDPDTGALHN